jgi:peptidoglycan/LPS O-acetylase OafA/YrhL
VIEYPEFATRKRFANLDGLRFICILAVLWHHGPQAREYDQSSLLSQGFLGVDFFFVLSGFLITTLLLREQSSTGEISLVKFYWRRAIRIFPPYFLLVFTMAVLAMGVKGEWHYISVLPAYIVFSSNFIVDHIPNLDPTWSLAVEEQYYLLWPLLLFRFWWRALPSMWVSCGMTWRSARSLALPPRISTSSCPTPPTPPFSWVRSWR